MDLGKITTTYIAYGIPAVPLVPCAESTSAFLAARRQKSGWDGTRMFVPPNFIGARRNVFYLPREVPKGRGSAD